MLALYGAETRDKSSYALLLMHWILTLPLLNIEKEEHLENHLDNLASLKAWRMGGGRTSNDSMA
jgi:hypothetical protein